MIGDSRRLGAPPPSGYRSRPTPTFALMAVLAGVPAGGAHHMACSGMTNMSPLGGMAVMYALMSAFHLRRWLKLIFPGRRTARALGVGA